MAKRSPILGYNHNVRYRGLIFHVQTEDSGILSPHLFTHLFHAGVILSTRKLVYDSGSAEDAIKSLMQAQHKAVLKDLRRGVFDDKIDSYLVGTPGLLPRDAEPRPSQPELGRASEPIIEVIDSEPLPASTPVEVAPEATLETSHATYGEPQTQPMGDITLRDARPPQMGRTQTAQRKSQSSGVVLPAHDTVRVDSAPEIEVIDSPAVAARSISEAHSWNDQPSQPEIEIQLELDDDDSPRRRTRDTLVTPEADHSDGVPQGVGRAAQPPPLPPPRVSTPPAIPPPRQPSVGAAALPPARPITRPPARPAITPPQVVSRPLVGQTSDAIEVYAPAPASVEPPPGSVDRPATTYAQHRRMKTNVEGNTPPPVRQPPPMGKPQRSGTSRDRESGGYPAVRPPPPAPTAPAPPSDSHRERTPTPSRNSGSPPAQARTPSPNSGVVMTRPAVIVGAPSKSSPARVRKAREDEGRGFGQGLISEKSLDEVILAYLSEDADDKK